MPNRAENYLALLILLVALLLAFWAWAITDREPTAIEMSVAYREYWVASSSQISNDALRRQINEVQLNKLSCQRIVPKSYECTVSISFIGNSAVEPSRPDRFLFIKGKSGWRFKPLH